MEEIKKLLEEQGRAFEEFKKTNDARIAAVESKGHAPVDLEIKLGTINSELNRIGKELDELAKKANRPPAPQGSGLTAEQVEHKTAFRDKFMRKGITDGLTALEQKALRVGSDPDGGYFADTETVGAIDRVAMNTVCMRQIATVTAISTSSWKEPIVTSGMSSGWAGETTTDSETTNPKMAEIEIVPGTQWVEPYATNQMLEDASIDIGAWLAEEAGFTFATDEDAAFISGTGVNKPRGILGYTMVVDSSYVWGKVGWVVSGKSSAFTDTDPADALVNLQTALKVRYWPGANFLMKGTTLAEVRKFKDGFGNYLWQPGLTLGAPSLLLGKPVALSDNMPTIGVDSYSIAFGDFKRAYRIVDRRGVQVLRDPFTSKPYVKFYTTRRVGGGVKNFEAFKVMKFSA